MKLWMTEGHITFPSTLKLHTLSTVLGLAPFAIFMALVYAFDSSGTVYINDVHYTGVAASAALLFIVLPLVAVLNGVFGGALMWFGVWLYSLKKPLQIEEMPEE